MSTGKRFRAAVIGGSGYGGAEMIRRLLIHPEVELVRVASVDFVGEPLSAADPALEGATELVFEDLPPAEAARGVDVVLLGLPHTVAAAKVPELAALPGVKVVDMSGDFRLSDAAAYERWYRHVHPCPELLAGLRLRPARAEPRADPRGPLRGLARLLRHHHRARAPAAGAGRAARAASSTCRASPARPARASAPVGRHAPPGPGREPQDLQAARAPARAGDQRDARRGRRARPRSSASCRSRRRSSRGILATAFVELPEEWTPERLERLYREPTPASRSCACRARRLPEVAAVSGSNYAEVGVVAGRRRARAGGP